MNLNTSSQLARLEGKLVMQVSVWTIQPRDVPCAKYVCRRWHVGGESANGAIYGVGVPAPGVKTAQRVGGILNEYITSWWPHA